jgi:rhodanese-related sulfurtransferase
MTDQPTADEPSANGPTADGPASSQVDELVGRARAGYRRAEAAEAAQRAAAGALLVDIRPAAQRAEFGEVPGALIIERNVLEWRLDPTSPHRHPAVTGPDQDIVIFCQAGYASSLAAATLHRLGLRHATDLVGGFEAWEQSGLPVTGHRRQPGRGGVDNDGHTEG